MAKTKGKAEVGTGAKGTGVRIDGWKTKTISFNYKGRKYEERINGKLVLTEMSLGEIKDHLNTLPGKFAFYKALMGDALLEKERAQGKYELWHAGKYEEAKFAIDDKKPTETAIKNRIMLDNTADYQRLKGVELELEFMLSQIGAIVDGYNMQSWTLRSIANLTQQELANIEVHGKNASLADV